MMHGNYYEKRHNFAASRATQYIFYRLKKTCAMQLLANWQSRLCVCVSLKEELSTCKYHPVGVYNGIYLLYISGQFHVMLHIHIFSLNYLLSLT